MSIFILVSIGCDDCSMALTDTLLLICVRNLILSFVDIFGPTLFIVVLAILGYHDIFIPPVRHDVTGAVLAQYIFTA